MAAVASEVLHPLQSAFSRGEVSPQLFGRVDLQGWSQGLRTLRNHVVRQEGSVSNRQGFKFCGNAVVNVARGSILIPFIFSATQAYVLEVGNLTAQVYALGGIVAAASTVAISAATLVGAGVGFAVQFTTAAPHGLVAGQNVALAGIIGTGSFALNGAQVVASVIDTTHFTVAAPLGNTGAYTSGGTVSPASSFVTPWAAADLPLLRWSQSADTLTLVHPNYPTYEIKRTSANTFTCLAAVFTNGPFLTQNTDGTTFVYASAQSGTVDLQSNGNIFNANHVGALFKLTEQDLSQVQPWEATKAITGIPGAMRRSNGKNYTAMSPVIAGGTTETGSVAPSHSQGVQADGDGIGIAGLAGSQAGVFWAYHDSGFGIVQITQFISASHVKGVVQPNYPGGGALLPVSVVGGPQVIFTSTFSGDGSTTSFLISSATSTDPNKFYVFVNNVYQPPSMYSITGSGASSHILFIVPPPVGGTNVQVSQISTLGQTTYWAFGAFSADQGYPSAVSYFPDRLVLAATPKQPVGVFGSKTAQYHDFGTSSPLVASDAFSVFLNARQLNAINDLIPLSDLLAGTSNIIWRLWPGSTGTALGPLAIKADPQSFYGENLGCASVLFGDSAIFAEYDGRRLRDLIYQFAYDKFVGQELTLYSRHLIPFGTSFARLAYKPDTQGHLVIGLRSDGVLLVCTYLREQQLVGWARWDTQGTFEDICVIPEANSFALYAIVNRAGARYVERLTSREVATIFDYNFLDCSIGYDGRNVSATTMRLVGGSTYAAGDTATLNASSAAGWANFAASDVTSNNEIWLFQSFAFACSVAGQSDGLLQTAVAPGGYVLTFSDGECRYVTIAADGVTATWEGVLASGTIRSAVCRVRALITGYASATQVTVRLRDPCPLGLQSIPTSTWTFARTTFGGAAQLANRAIVAYVDGNVLGINADANTPNGSLTVSSDGALTLPIAGGVVQLGLPYLCDFESLPLNEQGQETIRMRAKVTPVIYLDVTESRNVLAGTDFTNLMPHAERAFEPYTAPTEIQDGISYIRVASELSSECHTCIRQNMPLPITIRALIPQVTVGDPVS